MLSRSAIAGALSFALLAAACRSGALRAGGYESIRLDDIAPKYLTLTQSWNALGLDDRGRVYSVWTSRRDDGREDAALFRFTPATKQREFLGTFIDVAAAQGNLRQAEELPKGHTRIVQVGRKLYMASQGFHDFKADIDALPKYRGAHLFSYDLDRGVLEDVTRNLPDGVLLEHQGIIALAYSPEHRLLIGLSHPHSDLVLFDPAAGAIRKLVRGIPWQRERMVSREFIVTRTGKIYTMRGAEEAKLRSVENEVWVYDIAKDEQHATGQHLTGGFWNGLAEAPDRNTFYVSTVSGELYAFDVASERFSRLGDFIAAEDAQYRVKYLYGIALLPAADAIVGVPILERNGGGRARHTLSRVTEYSIARREFRAIASVERAVHTGSAHVDRRGNVYMAAFDWDTNCRLAILTPSLTAASSNRSH